jgi:hypothetical protein
MLLVSFSLSHWERAGVRAYRPALGSPIIRHSPPTTHYPLPTLAPAGLPSVPTHGSLLIARCFDSYTS